MFLPKFDSDCALTSYSFFSRVHLSHLNALFILALAVLRQHFVWPILIDFQTGFAIQATVLVFANVVHAVLAIEVALDGLVTLDELTELPLQAEVLVVECRHATIEGIVLAKQASLAPHHLVRVFDQHHWELHCQKKLDLRMHFGALSVVDAFLLCAGLTGSKADSVDKPFLGHWVIILIIESSLNLVNRADFTVKVLFEAFAGLSKLKCD